MPALAAAAVGAGGSLLGGIFNKGAAGKAADAQTEAARIAQETQLQMYTQNRADMEPYRLAGYQGLDVLKAVQGLGPQGMAVDYDPYQRGDITPRIAAAEARYAQADPYFGAASDINRDYWGNVSPYFDRARGQNEKLSALADYVHTAGAPGETGLPTWFEQAARNFRGSPDYTWARDEALRGTAAGLAKTGQIGSGGQIRAMGQTAAGLASQNYQNYQKTALDQWRQNVGDYAKMVQQGGENEMTQAKGVGTALGDIYTRYMGLGENQIAQGKNQLALGSYANDQYQNYFKRLADITGIGSGMTKTQVESGQHTADSVANAQMASGNAIANADLRSGQAMSNAFQGVAGNVQNYLNQQASPYNQSGGGFNYGSGYGPGSSASGYDPYSVYDAGGGGGGAAEYYGNYGYS